MKTQRIVECPRTLVARTIAELQDAGLRQQERVLLWLAESNHQRLTIAELMVPVQYATSDRFHIPPEGMREIMSRLAERRLMIAAQVHSYPEEAFHSAADDKWAIVRHKGALSLVLPNFCERTTVWTFAADAAVYELNEKNAWVHVPPPDVTSRWVIT